MKKFLALAFILFASLATFAQEKTITQTEFDTIHKNSYRWRIGQSYRETRIQESIFEALPRTDASGIFNKIVLPPQKTFTKSVSEQLPNVGYRLVFESGSPSLKNRKEIISVGGKTYTRDGEGEWTETVTQTAKSPERVAETTNVETEYKFLGSETLDGQTVNVYAKIEKAKLISSKNNRVSDSITTTKHFYAENGELLKTESDREIRSENLVTRFNSKTTYENDSSIKIEAPR